MPRWPFEVQGCFLLLECSLFPSSLNYQKQCVCVCCHRSCRLSAFIPPSSLMQFTNTHVHVHTYFSLSCFLSLVFSCPPVFLVSSFLCRVFSPSPVFFCESPQEVPSAEAFTKNLKLPRRRAARRHTTGCSTATI
jgi:hypothetical protein